MPRQQITITLTARLRELLHAEATERGCRPSEIVRDVLARHYRERSAGRAAPVGRPRKTVA